MSSPAPGGVASPGGVAGSRSGTMPVSQLGNPVILFGKNTTAFSLAAAASRVLVPDSPSPVAGYAQAGQTGYEVSISAQMAANTATVPFLQVTLTFFDDDSVTALPVDSVTWYLPAASPGAVVYPVAGHGPERGLYLQVTVANMDAAVGLAATVLIRGCSRVYARDDWRWQPGAGALVPVYTLPISGPGRGTLLLAAADPTVLPGAPQVRLLPLFAGRAQLTWTATGLAAPGSQLSVAPVNAAPGQILYVTPLAGQTPASGAPVSTQVALVLPRDCCTLTFSNLGASNVIWAATVVAAEY